MKEPPYQEALDAFADPLHELAVEPVANGLINQTFKVTSKVNGNTFLLQQINSQVFNKPDQVQLNYEKLWKYLKEERILFIIPEPKYFVDNTSYYFDKRHRTWRVFEFMKGTKTLNLAETTIQARTVAETFAKFTASFKNFDVRLLYSTIPGFHDLSLRYKQFSDSLHSRNYERLAKASSLVEELKKRERYVSFYEIIIESGEFPLRVMHHDAKIANILFSEETGEVVCPVDFDTVMSGYFFSDPGDMIRSMSCSLDENSIDFDHIMIRPEFYRAIIDGYTSILQNQLTSSEKKYIHYAGIIMIYMQALRFMTDYLDGDRYYKTTYRDQNRDRTRNQIVLLQKLEDFLQLTYQFRV